MLNSTITKILIIDDHRLFADGLKIILGQLDKKLQVTTKYNARQLLDDFDTLNTYDLVITDLNMPNINGFDFLMAAKHRCSNFKKLIVSGSEKISDVENALRLGANGFVPKDLPSHEILSAINDVLAGKIYLPQHLSKTVNWSVCRSDDYRVDVDVSNEASINLRPRQLQILSLIKDGHNNKKIGSIIGISESAVKTHISNLFKTLEVNNRTAAVKAGIECELI